MSAVVQRDVLCCDLLTAHRLSQRYLSTGRLLPVHVVQALFLFYRVKCQTMFFYWIGLRYELTQTGSLAV